MLLLNLKSNFIQLLLKKVIVRPIMLLKLSALILCAIFYVFQSSAEMTYFDSKGNKISEFQYMQIIEERKDKVSINKKENENNHVKEIDKDLKKRPNVTYYDIKISKSYKSCSNCGEVFEPKTPTSSLCQKCEKEKQIRDRAIIELNNKNAIEEMENKTLQFEKNQNEGLSRRCFNRGFVYGHKKYLCDEKIIFGSECDELDDSFIYSECQGMISTKKGIDSGRKQAIKKPISPEDAFTKTRQEQIEMKCEELGFIYGRCAAKAMLGLKCEPFEDIVIPPECRNEESTKRGTNLGVKAILER